MPSAVIVRTRLPAGLEALRRRSVADAAMGVPAHLTMLFPFIEEERLDAAVRSRLVAVARAHDAFDYRLMHRSSWPGSVYVSVEPEEPFRRLQADLAGAFPAYPIYGADHDLAFVPHLTIADGDAAERAEVAANDTWRSLPVSRRAAAIEVIAGAPHARWRTRWRIRLGPDAPR